jgi:protoporphyrinogen/coproporphyrinogen III oxidase
MRVAVLGGGVTGLTAAWKLTEAGHAVRLFEAGSRLGGSVQTETSEGWTVEGGPNSFQEDSPELRSWLDALGLGAERIESAPAAKNRFIAMGDRLVALPSPSSPLSFLSSPLLSPRGKLGVLREIARSRQIRADDVSIGDFVRDHFGSEVLRRVVQPFVSGTYAGDPERLSARHALSRAWEAEKKSGSLVRAGAAAARRRRKLGLSPSPAILSFRRGMQALPGALASRLEPGSAGLNTSVHAIEAGSDARWRVRWSGPEGAGMQGFDAVVAALPAGSLSRLEIGSGGAMPLSKLGEIEHPPVASVFVGFRRDQVRHPLDGFGALVPAVEKRSILGVLFNSSLFAGRAPEGHVALTVFAGGALQPDVAMLEPAALLERVCGDLRSLLGTEGQPVFVRHTLWPRAIPQYTMGYGRMIELMAECERSHPGLYIGGSVRDGISIPDCLRSGAALAKRVS